MTGDSLLATTALLTRIAEALERLAPPLKEPFHFIARTYRYESVPQGFIAAPDFPLALDLLLGVDAQKAKFLQNLHRFADGLAFNNALLWGARGTGKSSLVKAAFTDLAASRSALRLVEIDRDMIASLPTLFTLLRDRPERFVVMCDDLSFEEGAGAAKSLKSALEGGVAGPPANVLFVATSNRRHLMPRNHDQSGGLLAAAEDAEEMVSASDRFGLWLGFPPMDQPTYLAAVQAYAERFGLYAPDLDRRALQWSQLRGGRSGRVALQFARDIAGEQGIALPL